MPTDTFVDQAYGILPVRKDVHQFMFLIVKSRAGHWGFPKGHANPGETALQAATREFSEETGVKDITVYEQVSFTDSYAITDEMKTITKRVIWFLGLVHETTKASVPVDYEEIVEIKWADFNETFTSLSHDGTKKILLEAREYLSQHEL